MSDKPNFTPDTVLDVLWERVSLNNSSSRGIDARPRANSILHWF